MAGSNTLWIPESAKPAFECRMCKAQFTRRERIQFEQHMVRCADAHQDALMADRQQLRDWNSEVDPEWGSYCRDLEAQGKDVMDQYKRYSRVKRVRES